MIYCVINFSDKTLSAFKIEAMINCEFTVCSMFDFSDQTSYAFINRGAFEWSGSAEITGIYHYCYTFSC